MVVGVENKSGIYNYFGWIGKGCKAEEMRRRKKLQEAELDNG